MSTRKQEWKEQFGFLRKHRVSRAYLLLLALATSRQDVERLHGLQRDNARLPNEQLAALGDHWQRWYERERVGNGVSRMNDTLAQGLLRSFTPRLGLAWWYTKLFHDGREEAVWTSPKLAGRGVVGGVLTEDGHYNGLGKLDNP